MARTAASRTSSTCAGQLHGTERAYRQVQRAVSEIEGYCAPKTFKEAADWLERHHDNPFFLYIDTWDPHEPWDPPAWYVKPHMPDYAGARSSRPRTTTTRPTA